MTTLAAGMVIGMAALQPLPSLDNGIDLALGRAGLTRSEAQFDPTLMDFYRQGEFASPFYEACLRDVWRTPQLLGVLRNEIAQGSADSFKVVSVLSRLTGSGSRRDLLGNPVGQSISAMKQPGYLTVVLGRMQDKGLITGAIPSLAGVPDDVQAAAALVLDVALQSESYRKASFLSVDDMDGLFKRELATSTLPSDPVQYRTLLTGYEKADMAYLYAAGQDMTAAVQFAGTSLKLVPATTRYSWHVTTAWGDIYLNGAGNQQYVDPKALLIIDTGGNDEYVNCPAEKSASQWLSVVIDSAGDDKYLSDTALEKTAVRDFAARKSQRGLPGPGSALCGVTVLYDGAGNDLYRSARASFGSATLGVSVMIDSEGDDTYDTYSDSIGYGKFGIGLVVDEAGSDVYRGFTQTMGCGLTGGVGMLLDQAGKDQYLAELKTVDFPSPQDPEENVSMSMGAGAGFRMDYVNGRSLAGGVGILMDVRGDDTYSGAVFAEGVGYWMGMGVLYDLDGNDQYNGVWYTQGAGADASVGALIDTDGNDSYTATSSTAMGSGYDFSFGLLWDALGDDKYSAGELAMGTGNANGIGLFADMEGTDEYKATGNTVLGRCANSPEGSFRTRAFSMGMFLDGYGNDTYPSKAAWARNGNGDVTNLRSNMPKDEGQWGIFVDR